MRHMHIHNGSGQISTASFPLSAISLPAMVWARLAMLPVLAPVLVPVLAVAMLLLTLSPAILAQEASSRSAEDSSMDDQLPEELRTGRVRFELLIGEPLTAMALNPDPATREQHLLRAQALSDLGLYPLARQELQALTSAGSRISAQAGLELVRLAMKMDDVEQAQYWLEEALPGLQGEERQEGLYRQAELMRQRGDLAGAASVLGEMGANTWTGLGYFNLAATYAERDQAVSRPLVALRVAAATAGDGESPASAELVNRSHIGGGLLAMREQDYAKAVSFFDKVLLDSYQAPRALYLHGVAQLKQDNVRGALQSFHRARKFPLAFPGAPEAYIAMGQGFDEAGSSGQAAEAFLTANAAFEKERIVLTELDQNVRDKGGYQALILASRQNDVEWFLDNSQAVTAPRLAWLMRFMEAPEAQQAVQRLAVLDRMDRRLRQKQGDLEIIKASVKERLADAKDTSVPERLQQRVDSLRERASTLQGRDALKDSLQAVESQIGNAEAMLERIARDIENAPARSERFLARIASASDGISSQLERIASLHERSDQTLTGQVRAFIAEQKTQLELLEDRSEQEIAHLYEYMAVTRLKAEQRKQEEAP